ncbi:MAG: hypothetical protein HXX20_11415 [Chloroflexi bacterium]|nr:hypothetical protein [Chloroflexota bacterium]
MAECGRLVYKIYSRLRLSLVVLLLMLLVVACGETSPAADKVGSGTTPISSAIPLATNTALVTTQVATVTSNTSTNKVGSDATPTPLPVPTVAAPPEAQQVFDTLAQQTSKTRSLDFKDKIDKNFMTREALAKYQVESFNQENPPEEIAKYQKINEVFGFIPKGFDLGKAFTDLQAEQVQGFYDPRSKKFYIILDQDPTKISPTTRLTSEHELTHVLQDQRFDIMKLRPVRQPGTTEGNDDTTLAITSLLEGDASLSQTLWLQAGNLNRQELTQLLTDLQKVNQDQLNNAPLILKETLTFPYSQGLIFVQAIYNKGGWDAVNKVFTDYNPRSTAQILHPEKYEKRVEPVTVELPSLVDTLGTGWKLVEVNTMGELQSCLWLNGVKLNSVVSNDDATKAVSSWAGDRYQVLSDAQGRYGYVWRSQWDNASDFAQAATTFLTKTYNLSGNGGNGLQHLWTTTDLEISLVQKDKQVLIVLLPKGSGVDKVTAKLGF